MKRKLASLLLCGALSLSVLTGCGGSNEESAAQSDVKTIFTYAIGGDTGNTLNTFTADDRWGLMTSNMVSSPLYRVNMDGSLEYILAESMEPSADGLVYTMKLKPDLKWSDGEPVTADDVVFTYDEINKLGSALYIEGQPIKVEKVDDLTVTFTLPGKSASVVELLSAEVFMAPKHIFEGRNSFDINMLEEKPVGTGPYVLEEYKTGQYLKFKANPNYIGGAANIETVVYRIIDNADTAVLALQNKEVDALVTLPSKLDVFKDNADFNITNYSEGRVAYMRLNPNSENMKDQNFRKGIFYALNREEIMTAAYSSADFYQLGYSFLPTISSYYNAEVEKYDQDIEKAKEMISGGPSTLKLCFVGEDAALEKQALTIQAELKQVGITVELAGMEQAAYMKSAYDKESKEYDMYLGGYVMGIDPDSFAAMFDTNSDNMFNFNNPEIDKKFAEGKAELDPEKRIAIYAEAQKLVAEEGIFYPFGTNLRTLVTLSNVDGIEDAGLVPIYTFKDVSKLKFK